MQRKREGLPAFVHQDAVTSLIKQEQIVLILSAPPFQSSERGDRV
jgi:hypothetical protein